MTAIGVPSLSTNLYYPDDYVHWLSGCSANSMGGETNAKDNFGVVSGIDRDMSYRL